MRYFISVILLVTTCSTFIVLTEHKVPLLSGNDESDVLDVNHAVAQAQMDDQSG